MPQLGEEIVISATYKKDKLVKDEWRIAYFSAIVTPETFPEKIVQEKMGQRITFPVKGRFEPVYEGEFLDVTGEWEYSKKTKEFIFSAKLAIPNVPTDAEDVKMFLVKAVDGIGPKLGAAIFDWCKGDLQKVAVSPIEAAASIKRLSDRKAKLLAFKISEASASASLSRLLKSVVDVRIIRILVSAYGREAYETVTKAPYDSVPLIGFAAADDIALAQGGSPVAPERIRGAALAAMELLKARKHAILVKKTEHDEKIRWLLNQKHPTILPDSLLDSVMRDLVDEKVIKPTKSYRYLYEDWKMEKELSQRIYNLGQNKASDEEAARFCAAFETWQEKNPEVHLHINQEKAVYGAANLFSVVTGGPGTGKTTVLKAIMDTYTILFPESPITLMAPTGLAAKRMTESCERKAKTIHKALNLIPASTPSGFDDSRGNKIHGGLVVVDEFSMVGIHLANFLLSAIEIRPDTRIVFVGDVDQLPPVTPGTVLKDLIDCGRVHVTRLTKNFRQAGGSNIADIAVKVNTGNVAGMRFENDCIFTPVENDEDIEPLVEQEFLKSVSDFGLDQTFVITPTHTNMADPLSSNSLNRRLQELVNPCAEEVIVGSWIFRVGDRVINKKNTDEVINGDIGVIQEIVPEDVGVSLRIKFSDNDILMPPEKLKNLELAYAITVHSSQGCEFKSVITPIAKAHHMMLTRNLTYTAITRAKKKMHLIGVRSEMDASVMNIKDGGESDLLKRRICAKKEVISPEVK